MSAVTLEPPEKFPGIVEETDWYPILNYTQKKLFDDPSLYILAYGEKGSGKSIGGLHALVRHCYDEDDALALIIAPQIRTGKEGALYDLQWVLDIWRHGNKDKDGNRIDRGIALEYTEPSLDANTKDRILYIKNRHDGWSKVVLVSIPYAEVVEKRMKDLAPSFVYVSEITELESKEYFTFVVQQLGRRRGIKGPQQYVASCNPEGPSHWVYKVWWEDSVDEETGERDKDYAIYHVPIEENRHNLPLGYIEKLVKLYKDPIDYDRLIKGRWIDRPSGDAIFKNFFRPEIHIKGNLKINSGLQPHKEYPIEIGWDLGGKNLSVHFEQMVPSRDKVIWLTFDEINLVGQFVPDFLFVPRVLKRMDYWQTLLGSQATFVNICEQSAFTIRRQDGSYDALRVQRLSGGRIRMRGCPQAKESVPSRVAMARGMFIDESAYISAMCPMTTEMLRMLVSEKVKEGTHDRNGGLKPQRSIYLHPFDSWTYPPYYFQLNPATFNLRTETLAPAAYLVGGG